MSLNRHLQGTESRNMISPSARLDPVPKPFHLPGICLIQDLPDGMIDLLETRASNALSKA